MAKKRGEPAAPPKDANVFTLTQSKDKTREQDVARIALDPNFTAGYFLAEQGKALSLPNVDANAFTDEVQKFGEAVNRGDLSRGEEMLSAQAHALNSLFYSMAYRSAANSKGGYLDAAETYMKLAMRAQSQCRSTWEAIAEIKNPRQVAFVKQANMGHNVQVNNGAPSVARVSRTEETEISQNKLLEADNGEWLDARATGTAVSANQDLEPVESIHGAKDAGGQGAYIPKRR